VPKLHDVIQKHFRIVPGNDNLPIVAHPLPKRDMGRVQLAKVVNDFGCRTGIEIGVGGGYSAALWCETAPGLQLTGIDPYDGKASGRRHAKAEKRAGKHNFTILKATSMEVVDQFDDESVDFLHIDGNHTFDFVVMDIVRYVPKVRPGGLVALHDYCPLTRGGVAQAVDAYVHCHRIDPWYITRDCNPTAFWERGVERA
jgi:predicted O-methyltransferase YrrM